MMPNEKAAGTQEEGVEKRENVRQHFQAVESELTPAIETSQFRWRNAPLPRPISAARNLRVHYITEK
jgi:hypothetical protein